jgi:hypothetical protein
MVPDRLICRDSYNAGCRFHGAVEDMDISLTARHTLISIAVDSNQFQEVRMAIHPIFKYGLLCIIGGSIALLADQVATTTQGKKVALKDDGTWRSISDDEAKRISAATADQRPEESSQDKPKIAAGSLLNFVVKNDTTDFRLTRWGMTITQVKARETAKLDRETKDSLIFTATLFELNCKIIYAFNAGMLMNGSYVIEQPHVDPARFPKDYENLKQYLQPLYGRSVSEDDMWKNEMYKDKPDQFGFAISIGFLEKKTVWKNKRTRIVLFMTGINHQITTRIDYFKGE